MDEDRRRLVSIAAVVGIATVVGIGWWLLRAAALPHLVQVRVVTRGAGETVATDRFRILPAGTVVEVAAVLGYRRGEGPLRWLCALDAVEVEGKRLAVDPPQAWPADAGVLRAHWFTVEPAFLGATKLTADAATDRLAYSDFLANELGRGLVATLGFEAHNDDHLSGSPAGNSMPAGVFRLKVRVGLYDDEDDVLASESVTSPGADEIFTGTVAGVVVGASFPAAIDPRVSTQLRLACFTFANEVWPDGGRSWTLPLPPGEMVRRGLITTPRAVAAAAAGDVLGWPWSEEIAVVARGTRWYRRGEHEPLRWGTDIGPGDAIHDGDRWAVLVADDGDGVLSIGDTALSAWEEPAHTGPLGLALSAQSTVATLLRAS